jgi:hypothetical protein
MLNLLKGVTGEEREASKSMYLDQISLRRVFH